MAECTSLREEFLATLDRGRLRLRFGLRGLRAGKRHE
jgi:hypothetical protein